MRPSLRAISARLIVGHLDVELGADLLATIDTHGRPVIFGLAEPDSLRQALAVPAGAAGEPRADSLRAGKLVLETVGDESLASSRPDVCDAIVDGLRVAHRRLGAEGLDLMPHGSSGIGFCGAALVDGRVQLVIVPPSQVFVVHQGVALSVPQSDEVGRGIWMRDDLRAEIFAGIGGAHEPDIRVYDAGIVPGDSLVLVSSTLARMLTEEDVRLAVAYEEAATGAERLKQLAVQRGVEAGVALVIEIAGSLEEPRPDSPLPGPIALDGIPRPALKLEMPPVGSIFSTARDWLLEAVDRVQATPRQVASAMPDDEPIDDQTLWPSRPRPGDWRSAPSQGRRIAITASTQAAMPSRPAVPAPTWPRRASTPSRLTTPAMPAAPDVEGDDEQATLRRATSLSLGWRAPAAREGEAGRPRRSPRLLPALARTLAAARDATIPKPATAASQPQDPAHWPARYGPGATADLTHASSGYDSGKVHDSAQQARYGASAADHTTGGWRYSAASGNPGQRWAATGRAGHTAGGDSAGDRLARYGATWRTGGGGAAVATYRPSVASERLLPALARTRASLASALSQAGERATAFDVAGKRRVLVPALSAAFVLLVFLFAVRTIKTQQARQVQQRYDSLITAAVQLEGQARADTDRNAAQGLVRRAQALLDQAATLRPNEPRVASVRNDLQGDLNRLDGLVALPQPAVLANLSPLAKDLNATAMAADGAAFYMLDAGGQRLIQDVRQSSRPTIAASKGDKSGANQLGAVKLLTARDEGALLLDSNRALWSYSANRPKLDQIGLKSADTWKDATAMAAYGPNLYVLDATLGNVWRYASRDGIFTDAPTRFFEKDNPDLLRQGVSLAIDGSIWVLGGDGQIIKLENGSGQPLAITGLAQPMGKVSQIATQAGFSSLYVLNATGNRVFEIGKDGRFVRQLSLSLPAPASSIWPDQPAHQLTVLAGNTLYQYQLP